MPFLRFFRRQRPHLHEGKHARQPLVPRHPRAQMADKLGRTLAEKSIGLVYGGGTNAAFRYDSITGNIGLMGAVARAVKSNNGTVIGVIPSAMASTEFSGVPVGEQ